MQTTHEGTLLHVCSFPAVDVFLYVEMQLDVVERCTNTHLYTRTICVEDHCEKCSSRVSFSMNAAYFTLSTFSMEQILAWQTMAPDQG